MKMFAAMTGPQRWGVRIHRFLSHFSGPIIWVLEITVVLLIIVNHSVDFVDAVIVANLVILVLMMAFRAGLGLWKDSHPSETFDVHPRMPTEMTGGRIGQYCRSGFEQFLERIQDEHEDNGR